jgi:drug/metabolite transporter (DMT)-like permease
MWLLFAALTGVLYTGEGLLQRFLLRSQKDAWAFSFFYSLVGMVISFPFMLSDPKLPSSLVPWLLALLIGIIIVGHNLLIFKASNHLEISLVGALTKLRLAWVFVLGIVFLGVSFSWASLLGTILTMIAGLVIIHRFKRPKSAYAISLVLTATILNALIIILSKYLLSSFNAVSLTFFATFLPATIFNFVLMPDAKNRVKKLFKDDWRIVLLTCGLGSLANLSLNQALSLNDANSVVVISEVFLILTLIGEHVLLKEKEQLWVKLVSVLLAIGGAILIQVRF